MKSEEITEIYVDPAIRHWRNHPEHESILKIFAKSGNNYYRYLSELFESNPQKYIEVEKVIYNKYQLSGPSLLNIGKQEGQSLMEMLNHEKKEIYANDLSIRQGAEYRTKAITALFRACYEEARKKIIVAFYQNGYRIVEIKSPDFSRFIHKDKVHEDQNAKLRLNDILLKEKLKKQEERPMGDSNVPIKRIKLEKQVSR
jgi:hypothetical protein